MRFALAALSLAAFSLPAAAQDIGTPDALTQVYACAEIADESQRLACYDGAVGRLREAQSSGNLVAVDRVQAQELEREAFGFSLPSLPRIFGGGRDGGGASEPAFSEMQLTIDRVVSRRYGPSTFYMTNGQVWVQIDEENARNARAGGAVTIRRATFNSFLMSVEAGGPAIRVRRRE